MNIQQFVADNPGWSWLTMVGTAIIAWIAPIAGLVTIGLGCLQGYISWQKYKHWKRQTDKADGRGE
jgi:hypothetical protein